MFFKWVFKTFVAVMILTNTCNIVLAVFDVSQHVIQQSAGIIQNGTEITPDVLDLSLIHIFCEYDQEVKHYPEKRGIVHNEILLPANAPLELSLIHILYS